jgi:hypothetical protein
MNLVREISYNKKEMFSIAKCLLRCKHQVMRLGAIFFVTATTMIATINKITQMLFKTRNMNFFVFMLSLSPP